jgi:hypothetical protein
MSAAWRGLTDPQRMAWANFADSFTSTNSLGQTVRLTGAQCYVKVNCVLLAQGSVAVQVPPALPAFVDNPCSALAAAAAVPKLEITCAALAAGTSVMVYSSGQISPGQNYVSNWKFVQSFAAVAGGKLDPLAAHTAIFGAPIAGKKIALRCVQVQAGMQDAGKVLTAVVAA